MILDDDPDICGWYPLTRDKEQHYQDSIEFIGEPTDDGDWSFYLQTEEMDWTRLNAATGYKVWHPRLGHVPFRNIEQTIQHSVGLQGLIGNKCPKDNKCPSCMIGKSTLENYPGSKEPDPRPMALVHMDIIHIHTGIFQLKRLLFSGFAEPTGSHFQSDSSVIGRTKVRSYSRFVSILRTFFNTEFREPGAPF